MLFYPSVSGVMRTMTLDLKYNRALLDALDAAYEQNILAAVSLEGLCTSQPLTRVELQRIIAPLLADRYIEQESGGLRLTPVGKEVFDRATHRQHNSGFAPSC